MTEIVVATHVPLFEEQTFRKPRDYQWELSGAYFGNFTTGRDVLACPKVTHVVSGHTHHATVEDRCGVLSVNPGSAGPRRFHHPFSVAVLRVAPGSVSAELVDLEV